MDNLILARKVVIETYNKDGYYNKNMLDKIERGEHDDSFVIRAVLEALEYRRAA